jgi:hypothetical protein
MNCLLKGVSFSFFGDISTQENVEEKFELVISALLGVIHNRLNYPLITKVFPFEPLSNAIFFPPISN